MSFSLKHEFVILCEGHADKAFFRKLIEKRDIVPFDVPFPEAMDELEVGANPLSGVGSFAKMLHSIRGDPSGFSRIKGVLLIADSANDPDEIFDQVCARIREANHYGIPANMMDVARSLNGHPATGVMLLPDEKTKGGLETLCINEFHGRFPGIAACVEKYLSCDDIKTRTWVSEKQDKARLQCMIAATNEADPNKSLRYAFSDSSASPIISVSDACFDGVAERIRSFCAKVLAP